jgi:hypothetical protein
VGGKEEEEEEENIGHLSLNCDTKGLWHRTHRDCEV